MTNQNIKSRNAVGAMHLHRPDESPPVKGDIGGFTKHSFECQFRPKFNLGRRIKAEGEGQRVMSVGFICEWMMPADMPDQDFETVDVFWGVQRLVVACSETVDTGKIIRQPYHRTG